MGLKDILNSANSVLKDFVQRLRRSLSPSACHAVTHYIRELSFNLRYQKTAACHASRRSTELHADLSYAIGQHRTINFGSSHRGSFTRVSDGRRFSQNANAISATRRDLSHRQAHAP